MAGQPGILAIFNDCRAGREADFEAWFQGEHLLERLAVPGFLYGRRHQAISGSSGYFNFYLVESPDVLMSKPYLERLDNPTPMTRKVMSQIFVNASRTLCRRTLRRGVFRGASSMTRLTQPRWQDLLKIWCGTPPLRLAKSGTRLTRRVSQSRWKKNCAAATRRSGPA
jgi:hypothetical protein